MDIRDSLFDELYTIAKRDDRVIFLTADADAFALKKFKKDMPSRFINVGVAEQNAILVASGLAMAGFLPFVYSITPFLTMRCYEQIKVNICSHRLPVTLIGLGAGLSFGFDGPTHHAIHDIGIMSMLPEMQIYNTADTLTAQLAIRFAYDEHRPTFIRLDKGDFPDALHHHSWKGVRAWNRSSNIHKVNIITTGTILHSVRHAVRDMYDVGVFDVYQLKPFPENTIAGICRDSKSATLVIEEHSRAGGLGDMVKLCVEDTSKIVHMALPHQQINDYGERDWLLAKYGLSEYHIRKTVEGLLT